MAEGKGFFMYRDGSKFLGHWKSNKANGDGIFIEPNGSKWIGNW